VTLSANRRLARDPRSGKTIAGAAARTFDNATLCGLSHKIILTHRHSKAITVSDKILSRMNIKIGDSFSTTREITDKLVRDFAELSGDHNPLHLDDEYAKTTRFGRRIAHGMLSGALISAVLGYEFKQRRIVYLSQTLKFTSPVYIGDEITTTATVVAMREDKPLITLETICRNQDGKTTLTGEAVIIELG
jgi:3-hydroxybutyryl-CoA dehydratase